MQFTGDHFSGHMRFMHGLVRQHGLADDVANGEDMGHVGAHLNVDVDEASVASTKYAEDTTELEAING